MRDYKETLRYMGFRTIANGNRWFDFLFARPDGSLQNIAVQATQDLFTGPGHMSVQEFPGICYETLKFRVSGSSSALPDKISLTADDVSRHKKGSKKPGRK